MQGPFTMRHYPNLPPQQQGVQRLVDEFNAAAREWERKHPSKAEAKKIVIIAGPNGAGKTTFAREFLPREAECGRCVAEVGRELGRLDGVHEVEADVPRGLLNVHFDEGVLEAGELRTYARRAGALA